MGFLGANTIQIGKITRQEPTKELVLTSPGHTVEGGGLSNRVQRFSNLDDIYPSLATCWPIHILISVFKFFCDVLTAELPL